MRAGLLTEDIEITRPVESKNEFGEKVLTYEQFYTTKARPIYGGGNRAQENGEILYNYNLSFEIYDYVQVKDTDHILYEENEYRILSIEHNKHQMKKIVRVEKVND